MGVFVVVVMMFGLKTAPTTFQRIIAEIFDDYITTSMKVFIDDSQQKKTPTESLKVMLSHAPVMQPPNWSQPFHVFVDVSNVAIGSALMQKTPPNWYQPVYYASQRLSIAEKNYSTTEHEALGMVYNITKFRHYLLGRKFTFHVDHSTLVYLINKESLTGRLARWMLLLQEFDFQIHHRPGVGLGLP